MSLKHCQRFYLSIINKVNKLSGWKIMARGLPLFLLLSLFYLDKHQAGMHLDFDAFYQSGKDLLNHKDPYQTLNLNPPIFFTLFGFLSYLKPIHAYILFSCLMAVSLCLSIKWTYHCFSKRLTNKFIYTLVLTCSYPVITNFKIGQLTPLIYLLIISGYYALKKDREHHTAWLWGLVIALKFFPALLLGYLLQQKKIKLFGLTILFTLIYMLLPLALYGIELYEHYYSLLSQINWYSHSWNFSIFGLPFKLFLMRDSTLQYFHVLKLVSFSLSGVGLLVYLKQLTNKKMTEKQCFLFSLCMMLLLSPLAWQYYLILFFMPLVYLVQHFNTYSKKQQLFILFSISTIIFPYENDFLPREHYTALFTFFYYCLPTFGMLIISYMTITPVIFSRTSSTNSPSTSIISLLLAIFMIITYTNISYIKHLLSY